MKIALAQMKVVPGRPSRNVKRMLEIIDQAREQKADLVAFPEMCVGGYLLGDKWLEDSFCLGLMEYNEDIRKASKDIAVAYGNVFVDNEAGRPGDNEIHPNKDGRSRKYNAVYVFQDGKPAKRLNDIGILPEGVQPKTLLPNYRIFDDERYFFSTQDIAKDFSVDLEQLLSPFIINVKGDKFPIGFEICEDLWCEDYRRGLKALNPTKILIDNGARLIVNSSSSPWTFGKNGARDRRIEFLKRDSGESFVPFLYVNCTGVQNNGKNIVTFDGGSTVYNKDGKPVVFSKKAYLEEMMIVEERELFGNPAVRKEAGKIEQKHDAIIEGIRAVKDFIGTRDDPRYVIGLSGGIDSAVVAALLVEAVGKEKVLAVNMPSRYNSKKTKDAAAHIANEIGIIYEKIAIDDIADLNQRLLEEVDPEGSGRRLSELNIENIQAKIRGTSILSNLAAKYNALFTNNGNKVETALGYATLYGDVGGAFAPIGDLTKTEVVELARHINEKYGREVIPNILMPDKNWRFGKEGIQPSAELKNNQVDPMRFGYHCALIEAMTDYKIKSPEDIMRLYLNGELESALGISWELIERWKIDDPKEFISDLEWLSNGIGRNVFKRIQSPPIIITSKTAYGFDRRESILNCEQSREYERLKEKILKMDRYGGKNDI